MYYAFQKKFILSFNKYGNIRNSQMIINEDYLDRVSLPDTNAADEIEDAEIDSSTPDPSRFKFAITFQLLFDSKEVVYSKYVEKKLKRILPTFGEYNLIRDNMPFISDYFDPQYIKPHNKITVLQYDPALRTVVIELEETPTPRQFLVILSAIRELLLESSRLIIWQSGSRADGKMMYFPTFDAYTGFLNLVEYTEYLMLGNPDVKHYSPLANSIIKALNLPLSRQSELNDWLESYAKKMIAYYKEKYRNEIDESLLLEDYLDRLNDSDLDDNEDDKDEYKLNKTFPEITSTGEFIEFVENPDPDRYKSVFFLSTTNITEQREEIFNRFVKKFCYVLDRLNIEADAVICRDNASIAAQNVIKTTPDEKRIYITLRMDYPGLTNYILLLKWVEHYYNQDSTSTTFCALNYNADGTPYSANILDTTYPFSDVKMDRCYEQHYLDTTWWAQSGKANIKNLFGISEDIKKLEAKFKELLANYIKKNPI